MRRTLYAALLAAALLGVAGPVFSAVRHVPADVTVSLSNPESYRIFTAVSAIPMSVRTSFARAVGDQVFTMAEPGAKWQATDVVLEQGLPRRRLEAVALSDSFCILFYEVGGRGHSYQLSVFRLSKDGAELAWRAIRQSDVTRPAQILPAIYREEIDDDQRFGF